MSVLLEWKKFNFFRVIPSVEQKKIKDTLKSKVTAYVSNPLHKILCDNSGCVHIFFRNWDSISFYANNSTIYLCAHSIESNTLVTLSEADCSRGVILKVWDLNKLTKRNGAPCIGTAVISSNYIATALNISYQSSYVCIAVGFEMGEISIFRGNINREFTAGFRNFRVCSLRITGIEFKQKNSRCLSMFVSSDAGVFSYSVTENNDVRETRFVLDAKNEPIPCCAMQTTNSSTDPYFIVGRYDAIYCYTSDGRGPCYAIEGEKKCIAWYENYIIIVIRPNSSFTIQRENLIIIIDISHKMIVLNKSLDSFVGILVDNKACFVLTDINEVFTILEKDINTKLELLIDKHLYDIALRLIKYENCDEKRLAEIYKLYGDHLYLKGDFEGAVDKYIKTIGALESYSIIRKFMGSKLVLYLSKYLDALLKTDYATDKHIELYINCNSRMNLPVKLDEFFCESGEKEENGPFKEFFCNINETMLSKTVLRKSDVNSATQHLIFDTSLSRFLRIINCWEDVEKFFNQLSERELYGFFKEHGQTLVKYYTVQTTDILKSICTKYKFEICPEYFISLFKEHSSNCVEFLEHIIQNCSDCNPIIYNFLFELYLQRWKCQEMDSQDLCQFLESHHKHYSCHDILIKCKIYKFWEGVLYFYKNKELNNLSVRLYMRHADFKNMYDFYQRGESGSKLWIQPLKDIKFSSEGSTALLQYILSEQLQSQSPLQIFQSLSEIKTSLLANVKEFFLQEHLRCTNELETQSKNVFGLYCYLQQLNKLLKNYLFKPIEIRSSVCDICKQQLNYPAVYFLCQHTYHKHCLSTHSNVELDCLACKVYRDKFIDKTLELAEESFIPQLNKCKDFTGIIQQNLKARMFKEHVYMDQYFKHSELNNVSKDVNESSKEKKQFEKKQFDSNQISKISSNPFDDDDDFLTLDKYDKNLNPFED